jgi:hypothetical protein
LRGSQVINDKIEEKKRISGSKTSRGVQLSKEGAKIDYLAGRNPAERECVPFGLGIIPIEHEIQPSWLRGQGGSGCCDSS